MRRAKTLHAGSSLVRAWEETVKRITLLVLCFFSHKPGWGGEIAGKVDWRGAEDHSNAVVYALKIPIEPIHPPKAVVVLDQINLTFVPHVLPILEGTTVSFPNSDGLRHNVFSPSPAKRFNLGVYSRGVLRQVTFDQPGEVALLCNVHPEMAAYILVLETPYFSVTSKDGAYALRNLPAGQYTLTIWHELFQSVNYPVEIKGNETIRLEFMLSVRK